MYTYTFFINEDPGTTKLKTIAITGDVENVGESFSLQLNSAANYENNYENSPHLGNEEYCLKCEAYKPERSHHCSICQKCVLKMDHHCPWYTPLSMYLCYLSIYSIFIRRATHATKAIHEHIYACT